MKEEKKTKTDLLNHHPSWHQSLVSFYQITTSSTTKNTKFSNSTTLKVAIATTGSEQIGEQW